MKIFKLALMIIMSIMSFYNQSAAQYNLKVEGRIRIASLDTMNTADSVVVWLSNGTLAYREVGSIEKNQVLSISNDTIFLSGGDFIKLPVQIDSSISNELQSISKNNLEITLSHGGGTIKDSILSETTVDDMVSDNGFLTTEIDGSITNELQTISRNGVNVILTNGGGFTDSVNIYTAGEGILISQNSISLEPRDFYIGQDTLGGIVYYIYLDSLGETHGLIISKTESTGQQYQSAASITQADRSWDGEYNMSLMINSPAKTYVESLGPDWYLPSNDEMSLLWHNRFLVNQSLFSGGHTILATNANYWTSVENQGSPLSQAWFMSFGRGDLSITSKTNAQLTARGIKKF